MKAIVLQNLKSNTSALRAMASGTLVSRMMVLRTMLSRITVSRITLVLITITISLLSGCSMFKPATIDSHLTVKNYSSRHVKLIQRQNCLNADVNVETLITDLRSRQMKKVDVMEPGDCVNLFAYDYDDAVIARQKNISFPPGFTWIIH